MISRRVDNLQSNKLLTLIMEKESFITTISFWDYPLSDDTNEQMPFTRQIPSVALNISLVRKPSSCHLQLTSCISVVEMWLIQRSKSDLYLDSTHVILTGSIQQWSGTMLSTTNWSLWQRQKKHLWMTSMMNISQISWIAPRFTRSLSTSDDLHFWKIDLCSTHFIHETIEHHFVCYASSDSIFVPLRNTSNQISPFPCLTMEVCPRQLFRSQGNWFEVFWEKKKSHRWRDNVVRDLAISISTMIPPTSISSRMCRHFCLDTYY